MTNKMTDDELDRLYQNRKSNTQLPSGMKEQILSQAKEVAQQNKRLRSPWQIFNIKSYAQISAICATLALVVVVVGLQMSSNYTQHPNAGQLFVDYVNSEQHLLESEKADINAQNRIQYSLAHKDYLSKQTHLNVHHQSLATVIEIDSQLHLVTCDQALVSISNEVLKLLQEHDSIADLNFSLGQMVALNFDENGLILQIVDNSKAKLQC